MSTDGDTKRLFIETDLYESFTTFGQFHLWAIQWFKTRGGNRREFIYKAPDDFDNDGYNVKHRPSSSSLRVIKGSPSVEYTASEIYAPLNWYSQGDFKDYTEQRFTEFYTACIAEYNRQASIGVNRPYFYMYGIPMAQVFDKNGVVSTLYCKVQ